MTFDDVSDEAADQEFEFEEQQVNDAAEQDDDEPVGSKAHALKATKFRTLTHLTVPTPLSLTTTVVRGPVRVFVYGDVRWCAN